VFTLIREKLRFSREKAIYSMSFQRAQGKIDMSYPHCYSLGETDAMGHDENQNK
jgi:hypothetical protein